MLKKDFLWGGAVAAHQLEGGYCDGKGLSVADVMTAGAHGVGAAYEILVLRTPVRIWVGPFLFVVWSTRTV